jgi:hypothetical protein
MHVSTGKEKCSSSLADKAELWLQFHWLFWPWLFARIFLDLLCSDPTTLQIPFVEVKTAGAVLYSLAPIARKEGHAVLGIDVVDGQPPVLLTHGRAVPRISMRMQGVGNTASEIIPMGHTSHLWDIKVCPV